MSTRHAAPPLARPALREDIRSRLEAWIVEGRLKPGSRVRDELLAQELGVSRTPVREALMLLVKDGFVDGFHQRGFHVRPMTECEVLELYPVTAALEALAVRSMDELDPARLEGLRVLARKMSKARSGRARLEIDQQWHRTLLEACPNLHLRQLVARQKARIRRYELRYLKSARAGQSTAEHETIRVALAAKDPERAASLLEAHWLDGMHGLLELLRADQEARA